MVSKTQAAVLFFGAAAVLIAAAVFPTRQAQTPPARAHSLVPSPPSTADPGVSREQIEQREVSLDQIAGLSGEQTVGLLSRMNPAERAEFGRRLTALPATSINLGKIGLFFRAWARFDPKAAFQMALNFSNKTQAATALSSVFEGVTDGDVMSLVEDLQKIAPGLLNNDIAQSLLHTGLQKWATVDGPGAAAWLDKHGSNFPPSLWQAVVESWAMIDTKAALAWTNTQSIPEIKEQQLDGLMAAWVKTDLPAAAEYARTHLDGSVKSESRVALAANQFAANDPVAALSFIGTLPEGSVKEFAQSMAATKWAYNDPAKAAAWVSSLPLDAQAAAVVGVVAMWTSQDPQAAGEWINTLQDKARDSAISAYSAHLASRDPGTALRWAQSIQSDSIRTFSVAELARQWLARDPTSATAWISSSQISDEEKMRLLSPRR
jgi:hypothetical protein